jgi:hypothetical protein
MAKTLPVTDVIQERRHYVFLSKITEYFLSTNF